jgi:hypothetical protein
MPARFPCAVALCVALPIPGWSGLITQARVIVDDFNIPYFFTCSDAGTLGPGPTMSASCADPPGYGSAGALASYGSVAAFSGVSSQFANSNSFAKFQDTLTITGGMGSGVLQYIAFVGTLEIPVLPRHVCPGSDA